MEGQLEGATGAAVDASGNKRSSCRVQGRLRRHGSCRDLFGGSYRGSNIELEGAGGTSV